MLCWSIKPFDWAGWRDAGLVVTAGGDGWGGTTDGARDKCADPMVHCYTGYTAAGPGTT